MNNQNISNVNQSDITANINMSCTQDGTRTTKKLHISFMYAVCGLSFLFSVVALCRALPRKAEFDYLGVIVSVLSLLVAILMGWNIWQVIKVQSIRDDVKRQVHNSLFVAIQDLRKSMEGYVDAKCVSTETMVNQPAYAIELLLVALKDALVVKYNDDTIDAIMFRLYLTCCVYHKGNVNIFTGRKDEYINILSAVNNSHKDKIINEISVATDNEIYPFN